MKVYYIPRHYCGSLLSWLIRVWISKKEKGIRIFGIVLENKFKVKEVWCNCGNRLSNQITAKGRKGFVIEPCDKCLDAKWQEGYDQGYENGEGKE